MNTSLSPRVAGLLTVAGTGAVAGLATGRPELVVLATPFLLLVAAGLALAVPPRLVIELELTRERLLEGDQTRVTATIRNEHDSGLELELALERSARLAVEPAEPIMLRLGPREQTSVEFTAAPLRWGVHTVGPLALSTRDPLGITLARARLGAQLTLRVFPREQQLRQLVAPSRTQPFVGSHVARGRGDGIEFADLRPFTSGDRVRQVNWRASARRQTLYVTERHPEHASDVVLLLDTFAEARAGATGTLDAAVRATATLARAHLARRDRVALVDFGATLQWLGPAFGTTQLYRIVDALLASEIAFSYAWRAVESIPRRVLPPAALILAVTALLDERSVRLVSELRRRGADVTVVEVSPLDYTPPGHGLTDAAAYRLWRLEREAIRARLQSLGIGVAVWDEKSALGPALEEVNAFRRSARHVLSA